jgi:transposase
MPTDTAAVGEQVLAADDPYRAIGDHLAELLTDAMFADLSLPTGRAAISPSLLAMVTLFQFLEDVPDREAARLVVVRLDWKYALQLPLAYGGFDFSVLCYFRRRLLAHDQERLVFEALLGRVRALGFLKKRGKQRTDSLAVLGAVRELSELETVTETLRLALVALERADPHGAKHALAGDWQERYVRSRPDYRLSAAERQAAFLATGEDAARLLEGLVGAPPELADLAAVATLRTVVAQRYERVAGQLRRRERVVDCTERIVTPHDPGVRAGQKRGRTWHGDKVHVTETAEPADPADPHFLTDVSTAGASTGDAETLPAIRERLTERDLRPAEQVVDRSSVSGQQLAQSAAAGIALVGPPLDDTSPAEFKLADFQIDRAARRAICPGGQTAVQWSPRTDRDGTNAVNIQFAAADCAACPLRSRCTTSQSGRSLHLTEHYERLQARRAEAQTAAFQQRLHARAGIEATLSELVRCHGLRRHRYRGEPKRHLEHLLKGAACNLKRLARALAHRSTPPLALAASP